MTTVPVPWLNDLMADLILMSTDDEMSDCTPIHSSDDSSLDSTTVKRRVRRDLRNNTKTILLLSRRRQWRKLEELRRAIAARKHRYNMADAE